MDSPETPSLSLYEPLEPGQIRLARILPGQPENEVECALYKAECHQGASEKGLLSLTDDIIAHQQALTREKRIDQHCWTVLCLI